MERPLILITGAAKRVGRSVALYLARHGYDVAFTFFRSHTEALSLNETLTSEGVGSIPYQIDLLDLRAVQQLATQVALLGRPVAGIVNNASIYKADDPADPSLPSRMWRIHVEAPLLLAQNLRPQLKEAGGCVINMCDILGERPMPGWLGSCASKAAMANLTLGLARELAPEVRVNGIAPGVVEWPAGYLDEDKAMYLRRVPLGRSGTADDVAKLVHFLLTDGSYITGQILKLDGGRSIA
jgi:pteridine reductase